ncbi:TPA: AlpA family phage regulatory protein [Vibrio parahaemolyticus]|uniref:helix-turn-helix transcriptional regulator n=1 Tax=Vibrio parahaemolyticus TaxID=670 RepID=UPI001E6024AB|nr:AlpA family phage regulatory protein [Vibrio parahaemolyticus]HCE2128182.1 AlpA family phage regulatory protein [Vibrio parahaemolyticus]HCE3220890.1 AlpA family phage regulatory protein [Vibrio parahaemolyticus]HCM1038598.1 AlpA family phage regulatory protein [Vibrio parahaemolyticus]
MSINNPNTVHPNRLIKLDEVMHIVGLSRVSIYNFIKKKKFPQPLSLGPRTARWKYQDIQNWIMEKIQERDQKLLDKAERKKQEEVRHVR